MRQRNVKNLDEKLKNNSTYLIKDPKGKKGCWSQVFGNDNPICLEIGCGKGKFILSKAEKNRKMNFIAVEGQSNVALRALEKAEETNLPNLRIFIDFVGDLRNYFDDGELEGIFLNFSDPWHKAKHHKRRLTHRDRLANYKKVLSQGGFLQVKTDNEPLFDFTLEEIDFMGYPILEMTRDLHNSSLEAKNFTTEYEDKFVGEGVKIHYLKI